MGYQMEDWIVSPPFPSNSSSPQPAYSSSSSIKDHSHQVNLLQTLIQALKQSPCNSHLIKSSMAPTSISTSASLSEQHPFTFTSPVSSETHHEDALDFDYESWVQQSKIANYYSNIWPDDAEAQAIGRHHREMMLKAVDNLPEEAYELSLRDLSELSLSGRATTTGGSAPNSSVRLGTTARSPSGTKPCWRKKTIPSMEGAGFIIRLFMPSPSRAASGGGRKKSKRFSSSPVAALRENAAPIGTGNDFSCTHSHSMPRKSHQGATNRKPMSCYPFFSFSKYKVKREGGGRLCI